MPFLLRPAHGHEETDSINTQTQHQQFTRGLDQASSRRRGGGADGGQVSRHAPRSARPRRRWHHARTYFSRHPLASRIAHRGDVTAFEPVGWRRLCVSLSFHPPLCERVRDLICSCAARLGSYFSVYPSISPLVRPSQKGSKRHFLLYFVNI